MENLDQGKELLMTIGKFFLDCRRGGVGGPFDQISQFEQGLKKWPLHHEVSGGGHSSAYFNLSPAKIMIN